jgi:hypothetical protein
MGEEGGLCNNLAARFTSDSPVSCGLIP